MPIEITVAIGMIVVGFIGWLLIQLYQTNNTRHDSHEVKLDSIIQRQAIDDSKWATQDKINDTVANHTSDIAVQGNEIKNTNKDVSEIKSDIKDMNAKLDTLIKRG